jgi:hypothetical protein
MSINKTIDQIVEAFIPEMRKISQTHESEEQKERHYKAWLRATLQKFADDVTKIAAHDTETIPTVQRNLTEPAARSLKNPERGKQSRE